MAEDDEAEFQRLLQLCCFLTILCLSLFVYILYSLRGIIRTVLAEYKPKEFLKPRVETVVPLSNPGVITRFTHDTNENCLDLILSVHSEVSMFILYNIPLTTFHNAMLTSTTDFFQFIQSSASKGIDNVPQNITINLIPGRVCKFEYRRTYDLVIAFVDKNAFNREKEDERIALTFYMIHVKQHQDGIRPTGILYTYCKTNYDRLICIRVIFPQIFTFTPVPYKLSLSPCLLI